MAKKTYPIGWPDWRDGIPKTRHRIDGHTLVEEPAMQPDEIRAWLERVKATPGYVPMESH